MAKTYQYCVAENWGKGFIDHDESWRITFKGYPANVWQVPAYNKHANLWIAKVAGAVKTKDEAQTIVDLISLSFPRKNVRQFFIVPNFTNLPQIKKLRFGNRCVLPYFSQQYLLPKIHISGVTV